MANENYPAQIGFNVVPTPKIGFNVLPDPNVLPPHVGFKGVPNNPIEAPPAAQIGFNVIPQVGFNVSHQAPPPPSYDRTFNSSKPPATGTADDFDNLCQSDTDTYAVEIPSGLTKVKNSYYPPPPRRSQPSSTRGQLPPEQAMCCESLCRLHRYLMKINAGYSVGSIYCGILVMICIVLSFIGFIVHAKTA